MHDDVWYVQYQILKQIFQLDTKGNRSDMIWYSLNNKCRHKGTGLKGDNL